MSVVTEPVLRCRCGHSANAHTDETPPVDGVFPCLASGDGPGGVCPCPDFTARPAPWLVRRDPLPSTAFAVIAIWPWRVVSPRGVEVHRVPTARAAGELAHSLAAVEEMLARVNRLERTVHGGHPALKPSARPTPAGAPAAAEVDYRPTTVSTLAHQPVSESMHFDEVEGTQYVVHCTCDEAFIRSTRHLALAAQNRHAMRAAGVIGVAPEAEQ